MAFTVKHAIGAALISTLTSGCAGVMMMGGAGALPMAMMAVGAMDGIGLLDGPALSSGTQTNPALRQHPDLSPLGLSGQQAQLRNTLDAVSQNVEGHVSARGGVACTLSEDALWLIAQGQPRAAYEAAMAPLTDDIRPRVVHVEATLLEGSCVDGQPSGDFVAVGRFETAQGTGRMATTTVERHRLTARMAASGDLEGPARRETHRRTAGAGLGVIMESLTAMESNATGRMLSIARVLDADGRTSQIVTSLMDEPRDGVHRTMNYAGPTLSSTATLRDGRLDGWLTTYPVAYVAGMPAGDMTRTCYQAGEQRPDAACAGMPAA